MFKETGFIAMFVALLLLPLPLFSQSDFDPDAYLTFLEQNQNLSTSELLSRHPLPHQYYSSASTSFSIEDYAYLDSIVQRYQLTGDELELLRKNRFIVSERISERSFGGAFHNVYAKDLPVFVTTDAILHALHASYDKILMRLEFAIMEPNLIRFLNSLYNAYPSLHANYSAHSELENSLKDVDLYVTIAKSLIDGEKADPYFVDQQLFDTVWNGIQSEQCIQIPLFADRMREIDFSQFTVRGHYDREIWDESGRRTLENYFKAMMWLGRIDFYLTPPPENPWEPKWTKEEIRRMNISAVLLNEMLESTQQRHLLEENDRLITLLVGESDNLTPTEFNDILSDQAISSAYDLLNDQIYDSLQTALKNSSHASQKILSCFMMMDPYSSEPGVLPVSFRLSGQRFIIDSYIFSNVVFDRIIYNNKKIWRPLPDPLDAMFVLGNDNTLPLLRNELGTYKYASQLNALRYLVDEYDRDFWNKSLYNSWLHAIRLLNPAEERRGYPFFMKTVAWQQEKLNTQLASWAQLRHDNLLYAKQSYTGATGCSFPHSYIEPYPEFYQQIANFADKAAIHLSGLSTQYLHLPALDNYFLNLSRTMKQLETLAQKELNRQPFNEEETEFLERMLFRVSGSGAPPYDGWYAQLFYDNWDTAEIDYIIADVHTQPTDQSGSKVGRVLHVATGMINLGIFLAESPSSEYMPMAFVGPVFSYYEKITRDFERLNDSKWKELVQQRNVPERPDWTNVYLCDRHGEKRGQGRELPGVVYTDLAEDQETVPENNLLLQNYPNPFNPSTTIYFNLPDGGRTQVAIYDILGRQVGILLDERLAPGNHSINWNAGNLTSGVYVCRLITENHVRTIKLLLTR
ncbi:DUF3160 domain-containing protein [candidate division KSB1 bacterium]|nr:DUF3160 domain-containing protein [candidate division KSB1 bacterium]